MNQFRMKTVPSQTESASETTDLAFVSEDLTDVQVTGLCRSFKGVFQQLLLKRDSKRNPLAMAFNHPST